MTRSEINRLVIALTHREQSIKKDMATQISYFCKQCAGTFAEGHEDELLAMEVGAALGWIERKGQPVPEKQEAVMEATAEVVKTKKGRKAKSEAAASAEPKGRPGRQSSYAGKRIYSLCKDNPRRTWSVSRKTGDSQVPFGYRAMQLVIDAGENGITYEDYIAQGGRPNDLKFDLAKEHVEIR